MHQQLKFKTTRLHAAHRAIPVSVCALLPALQTQMSKPMQKSQQNGTVGLPSAHCFTPLYRKKATLQVTLIIRRVAARPVTVQALNTEAV